MNKKKLEDNYIIIYVYFRQPKLEDCPYSVIGKCPFDRGEEYYTQYWYS